jgi:hypothetical protein
MADKKIPVFISYDYDHDATLKEFLVGQAKNDDSPFFIEDWSVKDPSSDWKDKARTRIKRADRPRGDDPVLPARGVLGRRQQEADRGARRGQDVQLDLGQPQDRHWRRSLSDRRMSLSWLPRRRQGSTSVSTTTTIET